MLSVSANEGRSGSRNRLNKNGVDWELSQDLNERDREISEQANG